MDSKSSVRLTLKTSIVIQLHYVIANILIASAGVGAALFIEASWNVWQLERLECPVCDHERASNTFVDVRPLASTRGAPTQTGSVVLPLPTTDLAFSPQSLNPSIIEMYGSTLNQNPQLPRVTAREIVEGELRQTGKVSKMPELITSNYRRRSLSRWSNEISASSSIHAADGKSDVTEQRPQSTPPRFGPGVVIDESLKQNCRFDCDERMAPLWGHLERLSFQVTTLVDLRDLCHKKFPIAFRNVCLLRFAWYSVLSLISRKCAEKGWGATSWWPIASDEMVMMVTPYSKKVEWVSSRLSPV